MTDALQAAEALNEGEGGGGEVRAYEADDSGAYLGIGDVSRDTGDLACAIPCDTATTLEDDVTGES